MLPEPLPPVRPSRHVRATVTGSGTMLLDLRGRGHWHVLTPSAGRWWAQLATGSSAEQTAVALARLYAVPLEQIRTDGRNLIDDLLGRGLLVRANSTGARRLRRWWRR